MSTTASPTLTELITSSPDRSSPIPALTPNSVASSTRLNRYLRQINSARNEVLEFDPAKDGLSIWEWPTNAEGQRIPPRYLPDHCTSYQIVGPRCLCSMIEEDAKLGAEATLLRVTTSGQHFGDYIALCSVCNYLAPLERIYRQMNRDVRVNQRRRRPTPSSSLMMRPKRQLRRTYAMLDVMDGLATFDPPSRRPRSELEILLKLNDCMQPGLYEEEFRALMNRMARCACGLIMLQKQFKNHRCDRRLYLEPGRPQPRGSGQPQVVDLTMNID